MQRWIKCIKWLPRSVLLATFKAIIIKAGRYVFSVQKMASYVALPLNQWEKQCPPL